MGKNDTRSIYEVLSDRIREALRYNSPVGLRWLERKVNIGRYGTLISQTVIRGMIAEGEISIEGQGTRSKPKIVTYLFPRPAELCPTCGQSMRKAPAIPSTSTNGSF